MFHVALLCLSSSIRRRFYSRRPSRQAAVKGVLCSPSRYLHETSLFVYDRENCKIIGPVAYVNVFRFLYDEGGLCTTNNASASLPPGTHPVVELAGVAEVEVVRVSAHSEHGVECHVQKTLLVHLAITRDKRIRRIDSLSGSNTW